MKALYKYPQGEYPYSDILQENRRRTNHDLEYEIDDTPAFDDSKYWDVFAEYSKGNPNDILVRITVCNRSTEASTLHLLPTLWYRNTWVWGCEHEGCTRKPIMKQVRLGYHGYCTF